MAIHTELPLNTVEVYDRVKLNLPYTIIYTFAIMVLIYHRLLHLLNSPDLLSFSLFLSMLFAELVFSFAWALAQAFKFRPVRRRAFPERLSGKFDEKEFPSIDVFVCTADPLKEPPISVVNTALSAMGFDYPAEKLSVYVSDDGGSDLTLFAFMEAARFARHWLPFCKEHGIETRCPQVFFSGDFSDCLVKELERMKVMYKGMEEKIESVMKRGCVISADITSEEEREAFKKWTPSFIRQHHPTVIQGDTRFRSDTTPSPTPRSSHASSVFMDRLCIGQYCEIYGGFPMVPVANGEVRSLDPTEIVHGTPMGEGRCKLVLTEVINGGARLYKPDGFCETIEQVGVGGFVVWGKEYLRF